MSKDADKRLLLILVVISAREFKKLCFTFFLIAPTLVLFGKLLEFPIACSFVGLL